MKIRNAIAAVMITATGASTATTATMKIAMSRSPAGEGSAKQTSRHLNESGQRTETATPRPSRTTRREQRRDGAPQLDTTAAERQGRAVPSANDGGEPAICSEFASPTGYRTCLTAEAIGGRITPETARRLLLAEASRIEARWTRLRDELEQFAPQR